MVQFVYDDGGRSAAGFKGTAGDCAVRAVAIATKKTYQDAYDLINRHSKNEKPSKRRRGKSSSRTGVHTVTFHKVMEELGWRWTPTMQIGSGCTVHVREDELPTGRLILNLSKHYAAFLDGALHDTYNGSRNGTRCVYGYWRGGSLT